MKSLLIAALVLVPTLAPMMASATPKSVPCGTHEKNILDAAQQLYDQGALSRLELVRVKLANAKAQNACGNVSNADYCKDTSTIANDVIDKTQSAVDAGTLPAVTVDKIIVEMTKTIAPCTL